MSEREREREREREGERDTETEGGSKRERGVEFCNVLADL